MAPNPIPNAGGVNVLQRREIEAELAASFVAVIAARHGEAAADDILGQVVRRAAEKAAAGFRELYGTPTLADLYEIWNVLGGDGRLDLELEKLSATTLRFRITRCRYAEMYRAKGLERLGVAFSCRRDGPFAKALNSKIALKQSPSILEDHPYCAFEYTLEQST